MKPPVFHDRASAGQLLAEKLSRYARRPDLLILALPRGGVPVAYPVAQHLEAPLDVIVVRKLGVPCQPELAMGAIATGGVCVLNDELIDLFDIENDAIGVVRAREQRELERREQAYRGTKPPWDARDRTIVVVDDGVATGASIRAAIAAVRQHGAARVVAAAPVMSPDSYHQLLRLADDVVAVILPRVLHSVGEWFESFPPVEDDEVRRILQTAQCSPASM